MEMPVLTEEQLAIALDMAAKCETNFKVAEALGFPNYQLFMRYRLKHPLFGEQYRAAREHGLEDLILSLRTIPDEYSEKPHIARIKSDNIVRIVEKLSPARYGNRVDINVNQTIDVSGILDAAQARVQALLEPRQVYETTTQCDVMQPEVQSVDTVEDLF